jgi:hypothetical protein
VYDEWGDALLNNSFTNNGGFGNPTNGDFGLTNTEPGPTDCLSGNTDTGGTFTTAPSNAQQMYPSCNGQTVPPSDSNLQSAQFTEEVACDSQIYLALSLQPPCLPMDSYPRRQNVVMHPLPPASELPTLAKPCAGVPANPWCPAHKKRRSKRSRLRHAVRGFAGRAT